MSVLGALASDSDGSFVSKVGAAAPCMHGLIEAAAGRAQQCHPLEGHSNVMVLFERHRQNKK